MKKTFEISYLVVFVSKLLYVIQERAQTDWKRFANVVEPGNKHGCHENTVFEDEECVTGQENHFLS